MRNLANCHPEQFQFGIDVAPPPQIFPLTSQTPDPQLAILISRTKSVEVVVSIATASWFFDNLSR